MGAGNRGHGEVSGDLSIDQDTLAVVVPEVRTTTYDRSDVQFAFADFDGGDFRVQDLPSRIKDHAREVIT